MPLSNKFRPKRQRKILNEVSGFAFPEGAIAPWCFTSAQYGGSTKLDYWPK